MKQISFATTSQKHLKKKHERESERERGQKENLSDVRLVKKKNLAEF
jgi:hypothetical protein